MTNEGGWVRLEKCEPGQWIARGNGTAPVLLTGAVPVSGGASFAVN